MGQEELKERLLSRYAELEFQEDATEFLSPIVPKEDLIAFLTFIKEESDLAFDFMFCLTCVDWPEHFQMIYHIKSSVHGHQMAIKVNLSDKEAPKVDTVCKMYRTAEFHEREVYDLFGIHFEGHPDLRRILLTDDWEGYPLRKDYVDPINMISLK